MKKFSKLAVVLLMLTLLVFAAAACNTPSQILIEDNNKPRLEFVQGQDLDLSGGKLTLEFSNKTEEIALDSSDITVSGYDKNKLGAQELTITYKGKTTKLTVTVVARVVAREIQVNYFVGESINRKGDLNITYDDGSKDTVPLSDNRVTLDGFNSSAAATALTVTAHFQDFTGTFTVNVYAIESAALTSPPTKLDYKSHDNAFAPLGGSFTLTGNGGAFTKNVTLTADMVTGFNLNAATIEHRTNPLVQTLSVSYLNQHDEFEIKITFSDVSLIRLRAQELSTLDWTKDTAPTITKVQGDNALEAMELYSDLSTSEEALISREEIEHIARTAAVYGYGLWEAAIESYKNTFSVTDGTIYISAESYALTKADYDKLKNPSNTVFVMGSFLLTLAEEFEGCRLMGDTTIGDYLSSIYDPEDLSNLVPMLEFMLSLYEELISVPKNWTIAGVEDHATEITAAYTLITTSDFTSSDYRFIFGIVSSWRGEGDLFDIIYSYYFYHGDDWAPINALGNIYLPGPLETLYSIIEDAMYQTVLMRYGYVGDTTAFMLYYRDALTIVDEIAGSGNQMYIYLYNYLTFDGLLSTSSGPVFVSFEELFQFLRTTSYGYFYHCDYLLDDAIFTGVWNMYLDILDRNRTDADYKEGNAEFDRDVEDLFKSFVAMSPSLQFGFLASVDTDYYSYAANGSAYPTLDFANIYTTFTYILGYHYSTVLSQDSFEILYYLLIALETSSLYEMGHITSSAFITFMGYAQTGYNNLSAADKAVFGDTGRLGFLYKKCVDLLYRYNHPTETTVLDEYWQGIFDELADTILNINYAVYLNNSYYFQGPLITAYLYAERLAREIIENAPDDVVAAYYYEDYAVFTNMSAPLDYFLYLFRSNYVSTLTGVSVYLGNVQYMLWDFYTPEIQPFLADVSYVIWTYIFFDEESGDLNFDDTDKVLAAMASFRDLDSFDQILFMVIIDYYSMYYDGILAFFEEVLPEAIYDAAEALLDLELAYISYNNGHSAAAKLALQGAMTKLETELAKLSEEEREEFDEYLSDMYDFYLEKYEDEDF